MVTQVAKGSGYLTAFKIITVLNTLSVLFQAVTAGQLLSGASAGLHGLGAGAVHLLGLAQLVAAVLVWRPGRGAGWPAVVGLAILLLGFVQSAVGGSGVMTVHVPLGMAVFGLSVWLLVWAWRR
ncbi:hypothetical protein [Nonomuraea guangzhouensis]|uniref:DUF423 domain-containing protein n=1 Tax=Nonomuraea guangzhouensis TaxID=1291555 RepID=A0ABW4GKI5_9ACTN|nr:hypothetical protein [Nonomuraea guangzhouensis]